MTEKVFYSWQSDSPGNTNRNLISTALDRAIEEVKSDDSIEEDPVIEDQRGQSRLKDQKGQTRLIFSKAYNQAGFEVV